jgi:peptide/nickel transport system substrate-binding protein
MRRRTVLRLPGLLLLIALAGCGGEADNAMEAAAAPGSGKPAYGDTYIEALQGNISGLIPNVLTDGPSFEVAGMMYNGLVKYDKDLNLVGELAESVAVQPRLPRPDVQAWRNVQWHDHTPFTAADVVFTYETMINPKTPTAYGGDFKSVESVDAVDPYTVHIRYKHPNAKALQSWSVWMLPKHLLESYAREGKLREAPQNWPIRSEPGPICSRRKAGEKVVLVANPDYFDGKPYISRIVYRIIPSSATTFLELKAKGVDGAKLTALQFKRQTEYPAFPQGVQQVPVRGERLHLLRHEPARCALCRPARAASVRPRDQQA